MLYCPKYASAARVHREPQSCGPLGGTSRQPDTILGATRAGSVVFEENFLRARMILELNRSGRILVAEWPMDTMQSGCRR